MQKIGVAAGAIKSGERKDMGSPFRALTPEERAIFQSVIDDLQRPVPRQGSSSAQAARGHRRSARRRPHLHRASRRSATS